jgi:glycosyltransferase involved in cell wall biosynthesis
LHFPERTLFEQDLIGHAAGFNRSLERFLGLPPSDAVVSTSPEITEFLFRTGAGQITAILPLPPGTAPEEYYPRPNVADRDVQRLFEFFENEGGLPPELVDGFRQHPQDYVLVVEAGRMDTTKRKDVIVQAAVELPDNVVLLLTGNRRGPVYEDLRRQIGSLGLENRVFTLGRVPDDLMGPLCSLPYGDSADQFSLVIGASASRMEGWGMAVQDMTAGGYALIASDRVPYATFLARENQAAVIIPLSGEDEAALYAQAIRELIENRGRARDLAERGLETAGQYAWQNVVGNFLQEIENQGLDRRPEDSSAQRLEEVCQTLPPQLRSQLRHPYLMPFLRRRVQQLAATTPNADSSTIVRAAVSDLQTLTSREGRITAVVNRQNGGREEGPDIDLLREERLRWEHLLRPPSRGR